VDEHADAIFLEAAGGGRREVVEPRDALHLDEVVSRADGAELAGSALAGALRDRCRIGARKASQRLGVLQVVGGADPSLDEGPRAVPQNAVEVGPLQLQLPALAMPAGTLRESSCTRASSLPFSSLAASGRTSRRTPQLMS
jgi:hypothetical protein